MCSWIYFSDGFLYISATQQQMLQLRLPRTHRRWKSGQCGIVNSGSSLYLQFAHFCWLNNLGNGAWLSFLWYFLLIFFCCCKVCVSCYHFACRSLTGKETVLTKQNFAFFSARTFYKIWTLSRTNVYLFLLVISLSLGWYQIIFNYLMSFRDLFALLHVIKLSVILSSISFPFYRLQYWQLWQFISFLLFLVISILNRVYS